MTIIPLLLQLTNKLCIELNIHKINTYLFIPSKNEHVLHHRVLQNRKRATYLCIPCLLRGEVLQNPALRQGPEPQRWCTSCFPLGQD